MRLRTLWTQLTQYARDLVHVDLREQLHLVRHLIRGITLGALVGGIAGLAAALFLVTLDWATDLREANPWLLALLPIGGFVVALLYHWFGGESTEGNNLILDEIHEPRAWIPHVMAPLIFVGTVVTQLLGGSAGREGAAIQMSGSLSDATARLFRLRAADRHVMLVAALSGGFGALFGVPIAGAVFGLEVQAVGRLRYDTLVPCLTASVLGDLIVRGLDIHHEALPTIGNTPIDLALLGKVAIAGLLFGLVSIAFNELTHGCKRAFARLVPWMPGRPLVGGVVVILMTLAVGSQTYNGLSLGLIGDSFAGSVGNWSWLLKLLFTAVTLGALFQGGEVTPVFVIGAAVGAALAAPLGVPLTLLTALGFVAVFAGAANTPLTCTIMGAELFGSGAIVYFAVACVIAYVFSSHRGLYSAQRVGVAKGGLDVAPDAALRDLEPPH